MTSHFWSDSTDEVDTFSWVVTHIASARSSSFNSHLRPFLRHHWPCCLWDNSIVCSFNSSIYLLYGILPSWLEELAVETLQLKKMQNLKAVFDTSIKLVLNPPKAKKPKRKQRTCIVLWSCSSAPDDDFLLSSQPLILFFFFFPFFLLDVFFACRGENLPISC